MNQIDDRLSVKAENSLNVDVNNYNSELAQSEVSEVTSDPTSENSTSGLIKNEAKQNYPNSPKSKRDGENKFLSKIITIRLSLLHNDFSLFYQIYNNPAECF